MDIQEEPSSILCQVPDLDVTYLTHFHSLQGYYFRPMSEAAGKPEPSLLKPGIDSPMKVPGQFQMTSQSQVSTDDLLILHFILQCLDSIGSPPHLLYQYMQGFIHTSGVVYEEISFNLETLEQVINPLGMPMNEMAQHLSSNKTQCVVIFIMNHSDEDRGTSLSHQVHVPLWWRSVSCGHSERLLDHTPTVHGFPFTQ